MNENIIHIPRRLTPKEVGEIWGIHAKTVKRYCESGKLRFVPFGKLKRIPPDAILEYEEKYGQSKQQEQQQRYKSTAGKS